MADSYTLTLLAQISQAVLGSFTLTPAQQTGTPHYSVQEIVLANGDNTITVPTLVVWAIVIFDPLSVTTKKIKGAGGDTGITCSTNGILLLSVIPGATFIINSSALDTGFKTRIIFI